jgi:hypothetical protein
MRAKWPTEQRTQRSGVSEPRFTSEKCGKCFNALILRQPGKHHAQPNEGADEGGHDDKRRGKSAIVNLRIGRIHDRLNVPG